MDERTGRLLFMTIGAVLLVVVLVWLWGGAGSLPTL